MFARKSRLLGKARPYYLIVPLFKQRFREMFRQAQHDRRKCVIPSEVEESRGNDFFLIPRDRAFLLFKYTAARACFCFLYKVSVVTLANASARCFDKLNMTEEEQCRYLRNACFRGRILKI